MKKKTKKRGEYQKSSAYQAVKVFINEIYKKGIKNFTALREEYNHEYYVRYSDLLQALNKDPAYTRKKSYKARDPASESDFMYFYTNTTRHAKKVPDARGKQTKRKVDYLVRKSEDITAQITTKDQILHDKSEALKKLLSEAGASGLYVVNHLQRYEACGFYDAKMETKKALEKMMLTITEYLTAKINQAITSGNKVPIDVFKGISELLKGYKEYMDGCRLDATLPKEAVTLIQNNLKVDNDVIDFKDTKEIRDVIAASVQAIDLK